jgi:hypothetical protein
MNKVKEDNVRFSRRKKKLLIKQYGREVYRKLINKELVLLNGFPYTKPNQNNRMYPYNFTFKIEYESI